MSIRHLVFLVSAIFLIATMQGCSKEMLGGANRGTA